VVGPGASAHRLRQEEAAPGASAHRLRLEEAAPRPSGQRQAVLGDAQALAVLRRQIKQHHESLEAFEKAGRGDLMERESRELEILEGYLPAPLSEEELRGIVEEDIRMCGASGVRDVGRVMKLVMQRVGAQADGKLVNRLVLEVLGGGA